jgi:hypothetical protein
MFLLLVLSVVRFIAASQPNQHPSLVALPDVGKIVPFVQNDRCRSVSLTGGPPVWRANVRLVPRAFN